MSTLTTAARLKQLLPELFSQQKLEGDYYLRLQLTQKISILIELAYIQESLIVPAEQITAIPNLPDYILGLMTSRSQVFLSVDLAQAIGFAPETFALRQYSTVVIKTNLTEDDREMLQDRDFYSRSPSVQAVSRSHEPQQLELLGCSVRKILGISRLSPAAFEPIKEALPHPLSSIVKKRVVEQNQSSFLLDIPKFMATKINQPR